MTDDQKAPGASLAQLLREAAEKVEESGWSILAGDLAQAAASLEAQEPVATVSEESFSDDGTSDIISRNLPVGTPLYRHPPTSAVPVNAITEFYADGPRGDRRYNRARIAWELERTAMGDGYYGNALRVAKDLPEVAAEDRSLLDRYATGRQTGADHVALQGLALRIDRDAARQQGGGEDE